MPLVAQSFGPAPSAADSGGDAALLCFVPAAAALLLLLPLRLMMKRRRLLTDTPTSQAAGVTLGLGELKGRAEELEPLTSFLAEEPVVHYDYTVTEHWSRTVTETYTDSDGKTKTRTRTESGWATVDQGGAQVPFWLRDGSGRIRVLPAGAKLEPRAIFSRTCSLGDPLYYGKGPPGSVSDSTHSRCFTERAICLGDALYVMGQVRARQDVAEPEVAADAEAEMFIVSTRSEEQIVSGYGCLTGVWGVLGFLAAAAVPIPLGIGPGADAGEVLARQAPWMALSAFVYFLLVCAMYATGLFNGLVRLRERARRAWAMVEVELQRRADLIPNLAEAARAYAAHEKDVQESIAALRACAYAGSRGGVPSDAQVAAGLSAAARQAQTGARLLAVAERYPELKASDLFARLAGTLTDTENRLALGRSFFNASVELHNARLLRFPDSLFTRVGGFAPMKYLEAAASERQAVRVDFQGTPDLATLPAS